ncbi:MAG: hypothetical protein M1832_000231 [Thelocarpon impressellum]|nr:MAG: hypothetical protein M1832_000231 [Thelocarpon impressellum]
MSSAVDVVLAGKYPAKAHAKRVAAHLQGKNSQAAKGLIYLEGQVTRLIEDNDEPQPFRQRRHFYYLSGCNVPDCALTYDLGTSELTLFIPPVDPDDVIWSGLPLSAEEARERYDVDHVLYTDGVDAALNKNTLVFAIEGQASKLPPSVKAELEAVKSAIDASRVVKDDYEVALTRKANETTALAHTAVLEAVKNASNERELEALFLQRCIAAGSREQAYHSIVAAGESAATLHYTPNNATLEGKLNLLLDAGAEFGCYASDVTRTFPIGGKFTAESRAIYDVVLKMQEECFPLLKASVAWEEVHVKAHRVAIQGLLELGILKGDAQEIFDSRTSVAFFPHGLGHYLGMDTHDVGGNPNYKDGDSMFRYLRIRGRLPAGSIVTVEPGIYFCRFIIEPYLKEPKHSKHIDSARLEQFWSVGGVRIEDNVLITEGEPENLTTAIKDVAEMERRIRG